MSYPARSLFRIPFAVWPLVGLFALAALLSGAEVFDKPTMQAIDSDPGDPDPVPHVVPHLFIEPIAGLTTVRHRAPDRTAISLGTELRLFLSADETAQVSFTGATVTSRNARGVWARCTLDDVGPLTIVAVAGFPGGETYIRTCELDVVAIPLEEIAVTEIAASVAPFDLDRYATNFETMAYFLGGSIASFQPLPDGYLTSTERRIRFVPEINHPEFAPLMEWRIDGVLRAFGADEKEEAFATVGSHTISVGPPDRSAEIVIETYSVSITSHESGVDIVGEDEWITFEAVTDPPGYEEDITWLSSTKNGTATPVLGHGPTFTAQFNDTWGDDSFQWLGVKADNAIFNQDQKAGACCLDDGTCEELSQEDCQDSGGTFEGENSLCRSDTCGCIVSVEFEQIDRALEDNPNTGGGKRVFVGKSEPGDTVVRNVVLVKATINRAVAGVTVYFRSFDVDDPSSAAAPVDQNDGGGATGDDNRGRLKAGLLEPNTSQPTNAGGHDGHLGTLPNDFAGEGAVVSAVTDANGVATLDFLVTFAPGDNFRVVASCSQGEVDSLADDGVPADNEPNLAGFKGKLTKMLTVWRKLHLELEHMDAPGENDGPFDGQDGADDDPMPAGPQPDPDTALFVDYRRAYIEPVRLQNSQNPMNSTPFVHNNEETAALAAGIAVRDVLSEPRFWVIQLIGAYEFGVGADFDPNTEAGAIFGTTLNHFGDALCYVFNETMRDRKAFPGLEPPSVEPSLEVFKQRTAYHESLHTFDMLHGTFPGDEGPLSPDNNMFEDEGENKMKPAQLNVVRLAIKPD